MKQILIVVTSHEAFGNSGRKTGLWLEEFAVPFARFLDAGFSVTIASPHGGSVPIDPNSLKEEALSPECRPMMVPDSPLSVTRKLSEINPEDFDAVFYPGGHGPMWDLAFNSVNATLLRRMATEGALIGAVCHGSAAFLGVSGHDGRPIVDRRRLTGFSNAEEKLMHYEQIVPFLLEDQLKAAGALYCCGVPWEPFIVTDRPFVTGQNPASAAGVAAAMIELLEKDSF